MLPIVAIISLVVVISDAFSPVTVTTGSLGVVRSSSFVQHHGSSSSSSHSFSIGSRRTLPHHHRQYSSSGVRLNMMFDQLSEAISSVAKKLGPKQRMTEASVKPALRDVRRALLDADVNVNVADTLIEGVKNRSLGREVLEGVTAEQQFIKAMYDELLDMMGGDSADTVTRTEQVFKPAATLAYNSDRPTVVLLVGLQGAGKTTAAGKLALYLKEREVDYTKVEQMGQENTELLASKLPKRQRKVLLVAADVYRPAAIKQLEILGESIGVDVFSRGTDADPVDIAAEALQKAKDEGYDTVLVDTAGRQVIDTDLMDELRRIQSTGMPY